MHLENISGENDMKPKIYNKKKMRIKVCFFVINIKNIFPDTQ